ncbi:MAG: aminotransferase class V-fold PLP-dependent enzyme, partial [Enterobacterales bacterium]|nr:aminotransferase class V-fold PLP-dependent enzyme [Enterobacterales bacterium]
MNDLVQKINDSVIGANHLFKTPFGEKPLIYADYTASGRSLSFIEDYIREQVMPAYANTHTEFSYTGAQTSHFREQARGIIHKAVNGRDDDKIIFYGSGATCAINKLISILGMRLPKELSDHYMFEAQIPDAERPVV